LLGERTENRLGESLAVRLIPLISPFLRGGLRAIQPIQGESVAKAMVAIAQQDAPDDNPHFYYYDEIMSLNV
jgi:hypothetical protein